MAQVRNNLSGDWRQVLNEWTSRWFSLVWPRVAPPLIRSSGASIRVGDWVEVRSAEEIMSTLDAEGTMDGLPFMPEMLRECGRRFRVSHRPLQICTDNPPLPAGESYVRRFIREDVVMLEGSECTGVDHSECVRGCSVFWKESWLRRVAGSDARTQGGPPARSADKLLRVESPPVYFCQSSELIRVTRSLSTLQRFGVCLRNIRQGNYGASEVLRQISIWIFWKVNNIVRGVSPCGSHTSTPVEVLNLEPGELVEVKSLGEIAKTLDPSGRNRGLHVTPDMRLHCGKRYRVRSRVNRMIREGTGHMRSLKNTVILEGVVHDVAYGTFGNCARRHYVFWREIWLKRVPANS